MDSDLSDVRRWRVAARDVRERIGRDVAERLGPDFRLEPLNPSGTVRVTSLRDGYVYALVPGGEFEMGIHPREWKEVQSLDSQGALQGAPEVLGWAVPVHRVHVKPFLCGVLPLLRSEAERHVRNWERGSRPHYEGPLAPAMLSSAEAAEVLAAKSSRLPSEAEFEFVARSGGDGRWIVKPESQWQCARLDALLAQPVPDESMANGVGIAGLEFGEWVADAWHDSYDGAGQTSEPWGRAARPELARSGALSVYPWQVGSEYLMCHAAIRFRSEPRTCWGLRLALDLPESQ
jgi:formylglycine-generating enzyme required for sulfatase activity